MSASLHTAVSPRDHASGPMHAPITLVEYGDFECPYCGKAHRLIQTVRERLGDRLRFVFRNFPLSEIHPHAMRAAQAAESVAALAGENAYWRMHHALFENQRALEDEQLEVYASAAGADGAAVRWHLDIGEHADRVEADFAGGVRSGVNGTPTFFINGVRFDGDWRNLDILVAALESAATPARAPRGYVQVSQEDSTPKASGALPQDRITP